MKKHIRILTGALSLALAFSLCAPALAAEGQYTVGGESVPTIPAGANPEDYWTLDVQDLLDGAMDPSYIDASLSEDELFDAIYDTQGFVDEYTAAHREEYEAFDADAWFAENLTWWTKEEYVEAYELADDDAFRAQVWKEYVTDTDEYWAAWDVWSDQYSAARVEAYRAAHPGELEALDLNELLAQQGYHVSLETYMEERGFDIQKAEQALFRGYIEDQEELAKRDAQIEAYRAAHPGELEALDIHDLLEREGYLEPMAAYMEDYGYETEEEAERALLVNYIGHRTYLEQLHAQADAFRQADPESWAGFDPDAYLAESFPWYAKERYMEIYDLYTEEDYADNLYVSYMMEQPQEQERPEYVTLYVGGELLATDGDGVLTVVDGVSYVDVHTLNDILGTELEGDKLPVRAAADAAGWDVVWNPHSYAAVLVDRESVMATLDEKVGGLDLILSKLQELQNPAEDKSLRTKAEGTMTVTMFNTLDGDATAEVSYQGEALQRGGILNETLTYDAGELMALIPDSLKAAMAQELGKADAANLDERLGKGSISVIQNMEEGAQWISFPLLSLLDKTIAENAWIAQEVEMVSLEGVSLSEELYQRLLDALATDDFWGVSYTWDDFMEDLEILKPVGEATLNAKGFTWTLTADQINETMAAAMGEDVALFKECEITLSFAATGKVTMDLALRPDMEALMALDATEENAALTSLLAGVLPDFRLTYRMEADGKTVTENMKLHVKNQCEITLEATGAVSETNEAPLATPPEGDPILEDVPL